jgi:hypothetical protein
MLLYIFLGNVNMGGGGAPEPPVVEENTGGWHIRGPGKRRRRLQVERQKALEAQIPELAQKRIAKLAKRSLPLVDLLGLMEVDLGFVPPPFYVDYLQLLVGLHQQEALEFWELLEEVL